MEGSEPARHADSPRRPTLRDVAILADTSIKTASRVVNRERGVRPELVARVEQAVRNLGYRPDDRARRLRGGTLRTGTIGVVLNDVANPFFASVFIGVEEAATRAGHVVLAAFSEGSVARFHEIVETLITRRVDGLVLVPVGDDPGALAEEAELGTPLVFVDQMPAEPIGDVVMSDHFGGSVRAVRHLIDRGHRRIAFLGDDPTYFSAAERKRGWTEAMEDAGLTADPRLVRDDVGQADAAAAAVSTLLGGPDPPTALFTAQNLVSIGAIRALHRAGVADQVAMVGFDDVELADVVHPGLTVAPQDPFELGRRAAEILLRRVGGETGPKETVILPVNLVERGSGEITLRRG